MNDVVEIRVDDRLIHGQVAGLWTNALNITRLMVIDNEIANDETQKSLLRMVAPGTVNTSIIDEDKAFNNLSNNRYVGQRLMILVKSPLVIKRLIDRGLAIKKINLGNVSAKENTDMILPGISLLPMEKQIIKDFFNAGIEVTATKTPSDPVKKVSLSDLG